MNKKIIISLSVIGAVAVIAVGGTIAYFSDTETSTGNTFTAGTLDLKIDSTCHYNGLVCQSDHGASAVWTYVGPSSPPPAWALALDHYNQSCSCTWLEKDLTTDDLFFNYTDVKPGDEGENTISLTAKNNDAYLCAYVHNLANADNGCNEPEEKVDTTCNTPGELQNNLYVTIWSDTNCNNIKDANEAELVSNTPIDSNDGGWSLGQLVGDQKTCLGVAWNVPGNVGNEIQSDSVTGDISFYVEQIRNNSSFTCP